MPGTPEVNPLSFFLRNTLSGAQDNASVATNALIIPLGKRTNLARARQQINDLFDQTEKALKDLVDNIEQTKNDNAGLERKTKRQEDRQQKTVSTHKGSKNAIMGSVLGIALGYAAHIMGDVSQGAKDIISATTRFVIDKTNKIKDFAKRGFDYVVTSTKALISAGLSGASTLMKGVGEKIGETIGSAIDRIEVWAKDGSQRVEEGLDGGKDYVRKFIPDSTIPQKASLSIVNGVKRFWSKMVRLLHDWLWSLFSSQAQLGGGIIGGEGQPFGGENFNGPHAEPGSVPEVGGGGEPTSPIVSPSGKIEPIVKGPNGRAVQSAKMPEMMRYAEDQLRKEGVPEDHVKAAAAILVGEAQMESGLNPTKVHDFGTGYGIYGARLERRDKMFRWLEANGYSRDSAEGQMRYMSHEAMTDYPATRKLLLTATPENAADESWGVTKSFENPKVVNNRTGAVLGALAAAKDDNRSPLMQQAEPEQSTLNVPPQLPKVETQPPAPPHSVAPAKPYQPSPLPKVEISQPARPVTQTPPSGTPEDTDDSYRLDTSVSVDKGDDSLPDGGLEKPAFPNVKGGLAQHVYDSKMQVVPDAPIEPAPLPSKQKPEETPDEDSTPKTDRTSAADPQRDWPPVAPHMQAQENLGMVFVNAGYS
jgi:Phage tail lysozyme